MAARGGFLTMLVVDAAVLELSRGFWHVMEH
jgi:hypothetical protein